MKNLKLQKFRVYWTSKSEMFIPSSVWEETKHNVFEAIPAEDLKKMMSKVFHPSHKVNYLVSPVDIAN